MALYTYKENPTRTQQILTGIARSLMGYQQGKEQARQREMDERKMQLAEMVGRARAADYARKAQSATSMQDILSRAMGQGQEPGTGTFQPESVTVGPSGTSLRLGRPQSTKLESKYPAEFRADLKNVTTAVNKATEMLKDETKAAQGKAIIYQLVRELQSAYPQYRSDIAGILLSEIKDESMKDVLRRIVGSEK